MNKTIILAKIKFDLREPAETYLAQHEIATVLNTEVKPVKTIPALFRNYPFNKLTEDTIHIIARQTYPGEIQGYIAEVKSVDTNKLITCPAFFKEIYLIIETSMNEEQIKRELSLTKNNLFQLFTVHLEDNKKLVLVRLLPVQTLFEYVTDIKKLPDVAITPRNTKNWNEYFTIKEKGIEKGSDELLEHLRKNYFRAPHLGLGKKHIGDFVDWAYTDLRKPFLHYLHKYKGKGDPRISRALINLLNVNKGDTILDPFVGSGAFIADAPTMGLNAIGIEILEMGKFISDVKCCLSYNIQKLKNEIIQLFSSVNSSGYDLFSSKTDEEVEEVRIKIRKHAGENRYSINISPHLQKIIYLKNKIEQIQDEKIRKFLLLLLSQKIIEFSEKKYSNNFISSFQKYVEDRYLTLYATLKLAEKLDININDGKVNIIKADSTQMDFIDDNSIDGIVTSPPYFDALDYIGNNKISIIILGFDDDLKSGSTMEYYTKFENFNLDLPGSSIHLINILKKSARSTKAQIVENYLKMMKLSFRECYRVLKNQKFYAMVVSKYHSWVVDGQEQKVETSRILAELGISEGFRLVKVIQHGLSKVDEGKINTEDILLFQK